MLNNNSPYDTRTIKSSRAIYNQPRKIYGRRITTRYKSIINHTFMDRFVTLSSSISYLKKSLYPTLEKELNQEKLKIKMI